MNELDYAYNQWLRSQDVDSTGTMQDALRQGFNAGQQSQPKKTEYSVFELGYLDYKYIDVQEKINSLCKNGTLELVSTYRNKGAVSLYGIFRRI